MAQVASMRETRRHVIWTRGAIEIGEMTSHTSCVVQAVVVVDVALRALQRGVRSS